jgi:ferrous iron transport protein B
MITLYIAGILFGILSGYVMNKSIFRGAPDPFVMELPNYRFPSARTILILLWQKAKDFIQRAFTVIFFATVIIWFFRSFDFRLNYVPDGVDSILAWAGRFISVLFRPLGFADWRVATSLITGFTAKEAVISTLAVLTGASISEVGNSLHTLFTPLAALSFLTFTLLYTPCVAAVAAVRRELGTLKGTLLMILYQMSIAWIAGFAVFQAGRMLG